MTRDTLQAVLQHIDDSGWPADVVAMTGDLIQDDSAGAYERFRKAFEPLGLPIHCVPGNHDVIPLMRAAVSEPPFHYCSTFKQHDWLMIGIDSCKADSAGGNVSEAELTRLASEIAASDAAHVLVCLHHPPLPMHSQWLDRVGLDNGDELLRVLSATGKVRGCLFGHVHQPFDETHDGMQIIGTPSTCRQFKPGSDDFALDDRSPAYRRVLLHADGSIEHELVWVDAPGTVTAAG